MKIIHIMQNEKFTEEIVRFYNEFFNNGEHEILYYRREGDSVLINEKCSISQREFHAANKSSKLIDYLKSINCDYIILHSLFLNTHEKIRILMDRDILKRIVWIEWGADLYSWKEKGSIRNALRNLINYLFRSSISNMICIFPPDKDYYFKEFPKSKTKVYYAPYQGYPVDKEFLHYRDGSMLQTALQNNEPIYIQVGQNALETLNHIEVLDALCKFKDENIKIFLPLSYGASPGYVDKVKNFAENNFPGKVVVLKDFMPRKDYFRLTQKISIAIFDTKRQCALGNIHRLNFRNVKLFLSENCPMYKYFLDQGVPVEKFENIKSFTYEEFTRPIQIKDTDKFNSYIDSLSHIELAVRLWNEIYQSLKNDLSPKGYSEKNVQT